MVHQVGPPSPEGCMGQVWEGTSPGWAGSPPPPPTRAQGAYGLGRGLLHLTWGGSFPLSPVGRPPRWDLGLATAPMGGNLGGAAASSPPIYSGGIGASQHMSLFSCWRSPTSLSPHISRCLAKPCWTPTLLHHHHAVVLLLDGVFPNLSLSPC